MHGSAASPELKKKLKHFEVALLFSRIPMLPDCSLQIASAAFILSMNPTIRKLC
jgi:hypothetical protein